MKRNIVIPAMCLGSLGGALAIPVKAQRPNIIFIVTDDQPTETIGCWDGKAYTPNIDRLAKEGMKFDRAYCTSSISAASRYSILTGRYAGRCSSPEFLKKNPLDQPSRIDNVTMVLEDGKPTLQRILKDNGYYTGMVGKWHLGTKYDGNPDSRSKLWKKVGLSYYDMDADPADPAVRKALLANHEWYAGKIRETGFDYADNIYWGNLKEVYNHHLNYHNIDWTVKGALDFMDQAGDRPFFLYFSTTLHHGPLPARSVDEKYELVTSKGYAEEKMNVMPDRPSLYARLAEKGISSEYASSLWLDDAVGALMRKLEEKGELDNTVIFFFSDHGIDMKASLYEGGVHLPFIAWGPEIVQENCSSDQLVSLNDLVPTCLDLAGVPVPDSVCLDGKSLVPLLQDPEMKLHESVYSEIGYARCIITGKYKYIAVRYPAEIQQKIDRGLTEQEKKKIGYIQNMGLCRLGQKNPNYYTNDQLYDLEADPHEQENLASDPRYQEILQRMKRQLSQYLKGFGHRPFYDLN